MVLPVHVIKCSTDPTIAPPEVGAHFINTSSNKHFLAVGTSSVSDWKEFVYSVNSESGGSIILDADDISDATTTNKFADQSQLDKVDFISVTQAVDLDTLESDVATNNAKVSADGSIDTHSDVDLTGLANDDILVYDSVSGTFKPEPHGVHGVSSFNTRTGVVTSQTGDYDADQITETATREFVTPSESILINSAIQPGDNVSDLTNDALYIAAGGVCRIERTGTFYTSYALAITDLQDDDTLIVFSGDNSSLSIDFSSSSLSRITIFGKGPADNSANTKVGQCTIDSSCADFSFQNIDFFPNNVDSVSDTGSTGTCFVECSFNRTSGSVGFRLSGSSASGPRFANCNFVKDVSLNATSFSTFAFFRECNIPSLAATNNGGFQLRRCQVSSQVNITGSCIADINDCAVSYIASTQNTIGFDTLVLNDVRVRNFGTGAPSTINKTGTASFRLLNVDFDRSGSTLSGTDNSNHYPTSFAYSLLGKALTDLNALSRVAGIIHYSTTNTRLYLDDGSNLNQIAFTSDIGASAVASVFGRTGAIISVSGDYDADQITETATRVFVTPSQKALITSSIQPGDNVSDLTNDAGYITTAPVSSVNSQTGAVSIDADDIPDATTTNKFADQSQLDKVDFISITQAVDLDTLESNVSTNNAKISADGSIGTHSDVDLTGLANDDVLVYDNTSGTFKPEAIPSAPVDSVNGQTGVVSIDADDISDATTTNKFATQSQLDKVDFISVTQAVDLDTLESNVSTNNAKISADGSIGTHSDVDLTGLANDDVLVYDNTSGTFKPEQVASADEKVKVSATDTTSGYLFDKVVAGTNIVVTKANSGADEDIQIAANVFDRFVKVSANDAAASYLATKLVAGTNVTLTENNDGGLETLTIAASGGSGSPSAQPICVVSSTSTASILRTVPTVLSWNVEREKDAGFVHSNTTNPTRIQVTSSGTYKINANVRVYSTSQRAQHVANLLINGVYQTQEYGSSYIRNSGAASDYWTLVINPDPIKLNANDYVEIQAQLDSTTTSYTSLFQGVDSSFSITKMTGETGATGATGSGSNIIVQEDDTTVGTVSSTLNFEGGVSVADEGSNKTTVTIEKFYQDSDSAITGGNITASYGSPLLLTPSSGTLECTAPITGVYIISGFVSIGTNLNADNGAIELAYGVDTGSGTPALAAEPWIQAQNAKKNKRSGISGTWGGISLNQGDKVHLFLSTLGDLATWEKARISIATWA